VVGRAQTVPVVAVLTLIRSKRTDTCVNAAASARFVMIIMIDAKAITDAIAIKLNLFELILLNNILYPPNVF
jgi:hypothetical protein